MNESWKDFVDKIVGLGFEIVVRRRFAASDHRGGTVHPEFLIAAHGEKFLLLCATSFIWDVKKEVLNGGDVYGTLEGKTGEFTQKQWESLLCCSGGNEIFGYGFSFDVTRNLSYKLNEIEKVFKFIKWNNPNRFLYLVDYSQNPDLLEKYHDEFIASAPEWVRDFILPDKEHSVLLKQMDANRN